MATEIVFHTGATPARTRFGVSIRKVHGADLRVREHRANMFRVGVPPAQEPTVRAGARWAVGICGVLFLFSLPAASNGSSGVALWALLMLAGVAWGIYILLRKTDVDLPAASPFEFDRLWKEFMAASEPEALKRLSYDLTEDVHVRQTFGTVDFATIPEVISMPTGLALYPHQRAFTVQVSPTANGQHVIRWGVNLQHHVFANKRGLAYVCTEWDFIEDGCTPDGKHPVLRVVEMNQWMWRTIENLQVGEYSFVIQTIGANKVELPYVGRRPDRAREPGAYDWYYNTPAAQQQRNAQGRPPGGAVGAPQNAPVDDPRTRQFLENEIRKGRDAAMTFVNTVNSLRNEWEDRQ